MVGEYRKKSSEISANKTVFRQNTAKCLKNM